MLFKMVDTDNSGQRKMEFQNGEIHAYKPSSMHKLHPIVDDAHTFTPAMLFKMVDTDNSGSLSLDEFKTLHDIIVKDEQARASSIKDLDATVARNRDTIKRLRKMVLAAFIFCCAFLGIIGGMTVAVVKGFKDTETQGVSSTLYTSNGTAITTTKAVLADVLGNVMETAPAIVALPMSAAPVLPISQLNSLTRLTMSFKDLELGSPTFLEDLKVIEDVKSVVSVNDTCVIFRTSGSTAEEVDICFADVECSALRIDDAANADALVLKAEAALVAGGFSAALTRRERRRLAGAAGGCIQCDKLLATLPAPADVPSYFTESSLRMQEQNAVQTAALTNG